MRKELRIVINNDKFLHYVRFIDNYMGKDINTILTVPFRTILRNQMKVAKQFDYNQVIRVLRNGYEIMPFWRDGVGYALLRPYNSPKRTTSNYVVHIDSKTIFKRISYGKYNKVYKEELIAWNKAYQLTKEHLGTIN